MRQTEYEQRMLDQDFGRELDKRAARRESAKIPLVVQPSDKSGTQVALVSPSTRNYDAIALAKVPLDSVLEVRRTERCMVIVLH